MPELIVIVLVLAALVAYMAGLFVRSEKKKDGGFTLIELLIIIAIIGILASIVINALYGPRSKEQGLAGCKEYKGMSWNDTPSRCIHENFK